jgi:hypothetical protein
MMAPAYVGVDAQLQHVWLLASHLYNTGSVRAAVWDLWDVTQKVGCLQQCWHQHMGQGGCTSAAAHMALSEPFVPHRQCSGSSLGLMGCEAAN